MTYVGAMCERCNEWGACLDGLCTECRNHVETGDVAYTYPRLEQQCVICGADTTRDLCPRCEADVAREYDDLFADDPKPWRRT